MFCIFIYWYTTHAYVGPSPLLGHYVNEPQANPKWNLTTTHGPWISWTMDRGQEQQGRLAQQTCSRPPYWNFPGPQNQDGLFWGDIFWGQAVMRIQWFRKQFSMFFLGFWVAKIIRYNFKKVVNTWWVLMYTFFDVASRPQFFLIQLLIIVTCLSFIGPGIMNDDGPVERRGPRRNHTERSKYPALRSQI